MTVPLSKGGNVSLSKEAPGIKKIQVGLGWNVRGTDGADFDLDASCFMVGEDGKVLTDEHFIFYNKLKSPCGSVEHTGDNRTGEGDGDDEILYVDLDNVPVDVQRMCFGVTIHDGSARGQNFGMVSGAYMRILDRNTDKDIARYDLSEDASTNTAMTFGELYRNDSDWKFRAVGQGFDDGLGPLALGYGVNLG